MDRDVIEGLAYTDQVAVIPSLCDDRKGTAVQRQRGHRSHGGRAITRCRQTHVFLSDVNGVRRDAEDPASIIPAMSAEEARELIASGVIQGGMIPKVEACLETLGRGVQKGAYHRWSLKAFLVAGNFHHRWCRHGDLRMSDTTQENWIDGAAGFRSATGHDCDYLATAITAWNSTRWSQPASSVPGVDQQRCIEIEQRLVTQLQELTGHDENQVTRSVSATSTELALQFAIVLTRNAHAAASTKTAAASRCLCAVGSDHGAAILGTMASGRAETRNSSWPILPGFDHVLFEDLPKRINEQTAMVLVSPIDWHAMAKPAEAAVLKAIAQACKNSNASLVIDHTQIPPMGGGHFFVHDSIALIDPDAIILSAGLLGGLDGAVVVLGESLANVLESHGAEATNGSAIGGAFPGNELVATLAEASLQQWAENDWLAADVDDFAVELAQALASFETIRDLHVTGRTIAIETDVPSADWVAAANQCELNVFPAGDFAIALQPPLVMNEEQQTELLERIVLVFELIASQEQESELTDQSEPVDQSEIRDEPDDTSVTSNLTTDVATDDGDLTDADNTAETGAV